MANHIPIYARAIDGTLLDACGDPVTGASSFWAIVNDTSGGTEPVAGATITYTLTVATTGVATALGVVITDAIPAHTTYNPNTLTLNGGALTDTADADVGDVAGTTPDTVTVDLGDLVVGAPVQVIAFTVTID